MTFLCKKCNEMTEGATPHTLVCNKCARKVRFTEELIESVIGRTVGEEAVSVALYLKDRPNTSEFEIHESGGIRISDLRRILYSMQDYNLASYFKKKDHTKGYYISYWSLNEKDIKRKSVELAKERELLIGTRLRKESENSSLYLCPKLCVRLTPSIAVEHKYKCPECDTLLQLTRTSDEKSKQLIK